MPKKHYLYHSPLGRRLFDLGLGRAALSFAGVGGREDIRRVMACVREHGAQWPARWLRERGCETEARWWERDHARRYRPPTGVPHASVFLDHGPLADGVAATG